MMASGSKYKEHRVNHYGTETRQLIQMMMHESRLTDFQQRQINNKLKRDLEKEKRQLQNLLSTGQKDVGPTHSQRDSTERREQQIDRFQEVLDEIEERKQFLEDMLALGNGHQYHHLINTEISQKICELEDIDRKRSEELSTLKLNGKKEQSEG